jgi:hypothetical protein
LGHHEYSEGADSLRYTDAHISIYPPNLSQHDIERYQRDRKGDHHHEQNDRKKEISPYEFLLREGISRHGIKDHIERYNNNRNDDAI